MKKKWLNVVRLSALVGVGLLTSCSEDAMQVAGSSEESITLKEATEDAEINEVSDASSDIIEEVYVLQEYPETKSSEADQFLPSCTTVTREFDNATKTVTIDFGEGCTLRNGNVLGGKIVFVYDVDREAASVQLAFEYQDFSFNGNVVSGGGTILRERENANGNPQSTKTVDITVTWPDGTFAQRKGQRVREMIEGQGTSAWGDNVFSITGDWSFTRKNGVEITVSIQEALRRELACRFIVSGVIMFTRGESTALLDYGDGNCDDKATLTRNGGEPNEIHLRG